VKSFLAKLGGAAAVLSACFTSGVMAADSTFPDPNYPGGQATVYAIKVVAEQRLGLEIDTTPMGAVPVIWKAMDAGKGDIDVWPEVWMPNQKGLVDQYVTQKGTVKLGSKPYEATQGLCVTKMTKEKHGIGSVYDLISADNAKLFDTNGDGKGELFIGPNGWLSTNVEKVKARDYGYGENFELQVMEEAAALANLDAAVNKNKPFVFACYGPHHIWKQYDLVYLEEPPHDPARFNVIQPGESANWYEESVADTAWGETKVYVAYSKTLEQRAPTLAQLLDNVAMDADMVSGWIYAGLGTFIGLSLGTIALIAAPVMGVWAIVAIGIGARGDAMAVSDGDDLGDAVSVG